MTETTVAPIVVDTSGNEPDPATLRIEFTLDDDPTILVGVRPKMAVLMQIVTRLADDSNQMAQLAALYTLLKKVLDEDSHAHLDARFSDEDDDLDLPVVGPILQMLVGRWYGGPTGKPSPSANSRRRTSSGSTVRKRSKG